MDLASIFERDPALVGALLGFSSGVFVGWVGHLWSVARDRRKEFNEASETAFVALSKQLRSLKGGHFYDESIDATLFMHHIPRWRRAGFESALASYYDTQKRAFRQDATGAVDYDIGLAPAMEQDITSLLKYLRRR